MWSQESTSTADTSQPTQLPVKAYFDEQLLAIEQDLIFKGAPAYAGHSLMVPELHDYFVLPHRHNGMALIRNAEGVTLMSNVCRHRQATILQGKGNSPRLSCSLHRWTYANSGDLLMAPRFETRPCAKLDTYQLHEWNGLLFTGRDPAASLVCMPDRFKEFLSFDDLYFGHMEVHECAYNWKTFIEFYLEDYHVAPFHPGLGRFVSCDDLKWAFGEDWSVQTVGFHRGLSQPGESDVYRAWHEAVLKHYNNELPPVGAMWFLLYPNVMIEWYPFVTVISTIYPRGPLRSVNVVEYYHPRSLRSHPDGERMAQLAAQAYLETAVEDNQIGERMQEGRFALMSRGVSEHGPYHLQLEAGMVHFHRHYRDCLRDQVALQT
ncbi:MAG: aromatic ring-hydroxylating dioxygenase subunit alpha [Aquabacterium sp.]